MILLLHTFLVISSIVLECEGYRLPSFNTFMKSRRREIPTLELEHLVLSIKQRFVNQYEDLSAPEKPKITTDDDFDYDTNERFRIMVSNPFSSLPFNIRIRI